MFLRNFYVRGWEFFKKIPTRREFFGYLKFFKQYYQFLIVTLHPCVSFRKL